MGIHEYPWLIRGSMDGIYLIIRHIVFDGMVLWVGRCSFLGKFGVGLIYFGRTVDMLRVRFGIALLSLQYLLGVTMMSCWCRFGTLGVTLGCLRSDLF